MLTRPFFSEHALEVKIYSRTRNPDFKELSAVTTVPDHQRNKTCTGIVFNTQDYQYVGIENHVQKYIVRITFFCLLAPERKDNIVLALPLALDTSPYHAGAVTKFG